MVKSTEESLKIKTKPPSGGLDNSKTKAKGAENMNKRKYNLFVKLLEIMREGAETGVQAMSEAVEQNSENLFAREAMMRFKGREGAFSEVLELLKDEEYFYQMIDNYSIRG